MDYDTSADENDLREKVEAIVADQSLPQPAMDGDAGPEAIGKVLRAWMLQLGRAGYLRAAVGKERGGDLLSLLLAQKELARHSQWLMLGAEFGTRLLGGLIADHGTSSQKTKYLEPLLEGEWIGALAVSEPLSGSTPERLDTVADQETEGFVIHGEKARVSLAPMADLLGVIAQTERGPGLFLFGGDRAGVTIGERIRSLGFDELCTCSLMLEDARVPGERVIGPFSDGQADLLAELRRTEDRIVTALSLGIIWRCFDEARKSADVPRAHAKPPAGHQLIRFRLAEILALGQTADLLAFRSASSEALGEREAGTLALCAKVFASETAREISDQALQIMAASGYLGPNPVERAFRNARLGTIIGHTSEVARMAIGDDVLDRLAP